MDENNIDKIISATHWPRKMATIALGVLALFLFIATINGLKEYRFIGSGVTATNTITVSGEGEVFAIPDTATFRVTIQEEAKEVQDAQEIATDKSNDVIAFLESEGIDEKDIKTTDYSVYPQYDYVRTICKEGRCEPGKQVLRGFQVSQTLTVKVRDTEKAGELLAGVGSREVSQVSGLSFTIDDEDELQAEARGLAIEDAQDKAKALARQLGVSLVRIVGFNESGGGYPAPYAYGFDVDTALARVESASSVPEIPVGENKISSRVSVTFEIR